MPDDCKIGLAAKGFEVADETITDGNCGIHAFVIGLLDEAQRDKILANTSQLKQVRNLRNNVKPNAQQKSAPVPILSPVMMARHN